MGKKVNPVSAGVWLFLRWVMKRPLWSCQLTQSNPTSNTHGTSKCLKVLSLNVPMLLWVDCSHRLLTDLLSWQESKSMIGWLPMTIHFYHPLPILCRCFCWHTMCIMCILTGHGCMCNVCVYSQSTVLQIGVTKVQKMGSAHFPITRFVLPSPWLNPSKGGSIPRSLPLAETMNGTPDRVPTFG